MLVDGFPELCRFGNLTRWAVNCEGIQSVVRTIKEHNLDLEILCGSHWFASTCASGGGGGDGAGTPGSASAGLMPMGLAGL